MKTTNLEGRSEGRAEGLAEGLVKGREEGILELARKMKAKGISLEDIAEMTGMSLSDIENIGY